MEQEPKYGVKLEFNRKLDKRTLLDVVTLNDGRTRTIDISFLLEFLDYAETPRILKKLDKTFWKHFEFSVNELVDHIEQENHAKCREEFEYLYELFYIDYPDIKRRFLEAMRRRKERLVGGIPKVEANRQMRRKKQQARQLQDNKEAIGLRVRNEQEIKASKLYKKLDSLMVGLKS